MKSKIKIIPIFLSIFIFITSIYNCSIVSYASLGDTNGDGTLDGDELYKEVFQEVTSWLVYVTCRIGAIVDHDFASWVQAKDDFIEWWNTGHISQDEKTGDIIFSDELIAYIKQALIDYAKETNGYMILPTVRYQVVSPSDFHTSYQYRTFVSFVKEYGLIGWAQSTDAMYLASYPYYLNGDSGFYINREGYDFYQLLQLDFKEWTSRDYGQYLIMNDKVEKSFSSFDDAKNNQFPPDLVYEENKNYQSSLLFKSIYRRPESGGNYPFLFSKDGRNILVFKDKSALQNYSVEHRTVYFGSGFYEDTGEITVSFADFQDYLDGKYDDLLDDLRDIIGDSSLTEEEIEKIVDKLIGKIDEIDDSIGDVNDSIGDLKESFEKTNSWLEKIYAALTNFDNAVAGALSRLAGKTDALNNSVGDVNDNIKDTNIWLEQLFSILTNIDNTVADALSGVGLSFDMSAIGEYFDSLLARLDYISNQIDDITLKQATDITGLLSGIINAILGDLDDVVGDTLGDAVDGLIDNLVDGNGADGNATNFSEIAGNLKHKFPFSLPWDLNYLFTALADTPKTPIFKLPFVIERYGIHETLTIDLSNLKAISDISRLFFSLLYAYGLINWTVKIVSIRKDE